MKFYIVEWKDGPVVARWTNNVSGIHPNVFETLENATMTLKRMGAKFRKGEWRTTGGRIFRIREI